MIREIPAPSSDEVERLRAELEQRDGLSLVLERLLESLADGVIALDFRGEVVHVSDCLRDEQGNDECPLPREIHERLRREAGASRAGSAHHFDLTWERPVMGTRRYRVTSGGGDGVTLFALHDQTHVEALEAELARARNLAALGQMAATVAHELRNPLAAIQGFAGLLEREVGDQPQCKRQITRIVQGVEAANRIISDLLEYCRPLALKREVMSASLLLSESLILQKAAPRWNDTFAADLEVDPDLPPLAIDRRMMLQVLANLYNNAMDAMEGGGTLSIRVRALSDLRPAERVRIVVRDTGKGLTADEAARVFEPFYTTKAKGTGLGLAIVRRVVEAHGGKIHVVSAPGRGTSVVIDLPLGIHVARPESEADVPLGISVPRPESGADRIETREAA